MSIYPVTNTSLITSTTTVCGVLIRRHIDLYRYHDAMEID